jgi:phosphatidylserine/phosphatidylglycerophosphate/cardiolipin synthase-like enzyme
MTVPTALKTRYFGATTAHDETTEITYFVDGRSYFHAIRDAIADTVSGDAVYLAGWFFDEEFEPYGSTTPPTLPTARHIGELLADRAHGGVDVRVVVSGGQYLGAIAAASYQANFVNMNDLRAILPAGATSPPLANRVAYDWSGARRTGSHHQKATVVIHNNVVTAFVGGMDCNPLHLDQAPHNAATAPAPGGGTVPWGWHDAGVRLVGGAAADVWQNFADRWREACTLPTASLYIGGSGLIPKRISYTPPSFAAVKALPSTTTAASPTADTSVQVLRSRFRTKIERTLNDEPWLTRGGGEILEVHDTLVKAIGGSQQYIYVEDQFLGDHPALKLGHGALWALFDLFADRRLGSFSLLPHLCAAALARNVKVIVVGSGYADPGDLIPGPKNLSLHPELEDLAATSPDNLAVWRIEGTTVHAKTIIIDDRFAAVGSANLHSRSMLGLDSELHTAVVSTGDVVKNLRIDLWREHVGVSASIPAVEAALADLTQALGMWRTAWSTGGMWHMSNNPPGFNPTSMGPGGARTQVVRAYVGPGTAP